MKHNLKKVGIFDQKIIEVANVTNKTRKKARNRRNDQVQLPIFSEIFWPSFNKNS